MKDNDMVEEYKKYRDNFVTLFAPVYKGAVVKATYKPLRDLRLCEYAGCIYENKHYEFDDDYLDNNKSKIIDILKTLKIYKTNNGLWGFLPVSSLLSGNEETKGQELSLADAFLTLLEGAFIGKGGTRSNVNNLDFFKISEEIPGKKLLDIPSDLSQFIVLPERLRDKTIDD